MMRSVPRSVVSLRYCTPARTCARWTGADSGGIAVRQAHARTGYGMSSMRVSFRKATSSTRSEKYAPRDVAKHKISASEMCSSFAT